MPAKKKKTTAKKKSEKRQDISPEESLDKEEKPEFTKKKIKNEKPKVKPKKKKKSTKKDIEEDFLLSEDIEEEETLNSKNPERQVISEDEDEDEDVEEDEEGEEEEEDDTEKDIENDNQEDVEEDEIEDSDVELELLDDDDMVPMEDENEKKKSKNKKSESNLIMHDEDEDEDDDEDDENNSIVEKNIVSTERISKKQKKNIDRELTEIYENADGSMPDMSKFNNKKKHRLLRALFTLILSFIILGAVAYAGFFFLQTSSNFSEEDIVVSVSGEETVVSGEQVRYRIRYRNAQNTKLSNVSIDVRYPEGFTFLDTSLQSTNDANNRWELGELEPYDSGYIDVYGTLFGSVDQEQSFRVFLNYTPENFSSEFQKASNTVVKVNQSPVEMIVTAPENILVGSETTITIEITNKNKEIKQENLALIITPDETFTLKESTLEEDELNKGRWSIDELEEKFTLTLIGTFNPEEDQEKVALPIKLVGWADGTHSGEGFTLASFDYQATITDIELSAILAINGATKTLAVEPGEILNASLSLRNNSESNIDNIRVRAIFEAPSVNKKSILRWEDIDDQADGDIFGEQINDETRRGVVTWNKAKLSSLQSISQGKDAVINFSIPVKNKDDIDLAGFATHRGTVVLEVQYDVRGEKQLYTSSPLELMFNSDLSLEVRDEVKEGDKDSEIHTITWIVENSFHELSNLELKVDIYGDISFDPESVTVPAGEIEYIEENQQFIWRVESMPTSVDVLAMQFPIILNTKNPTQTNLTSKVQLSATDSVTGEEVLKLGDQILLNQPQENIEE